ncbi:MAG: hypothetical protein H7039_20155 [Bryobacteraceae bacterium]|nr:hypothetical protein [Bryobacteraceae bacterium]
MSKLVRLALTSTLAFCPAICHADVMYAFTYSRTAGPVQDFSFSFTYPTYATAGSSLALTPFTLTDGVNSWMMTRGKADVADSAGLNLGCFTFGTAFAFLGSGGGMFGSCSIGVGGPGFEQGAFAFNIDGGLPSAPGTYAARSFFGSFNTPSGFEYIGGPTTLTSLDTGIMSLTISHVSIPEPTSLSLMALALPLLYARFRSSAGLRT